jgi:hypothetical protein
MGQILEALRETKDKNVDIYTEHKLFGKQHIQMKFIPETETGWGFRVRGQAIYIDKDDVVSYDINNGKVEINGKMMSIKIILRS